jgi:hypothetical protein
MHGRSNPERKAALFVTRITRSCGTTWKRTVPTANARRYLVAGRSLLAVLCLAASAPVGAAFAACEPKEGPRFTPVVASRFVQNPMRVLGSDTTEYGLAVFTMQFAAARSRDLDVLSAVLTSADRKHRDAIALGLARAVLFCRSADATIAQRIEKWVARLPMQDVVKSYQQTIALKDDADGIQPLTLATPDVEDHFGAGLDLMPKPGPTGVGSLNIPDPTRLPGD